MESCTVSSLISVLQSLPKDAEVFVISDMYLQPVIGVCMMSSDEVEDSKEDEKMCVISFDGGLDMSNIDIGMLN